MLPSVDAMYLKSSHTRKLGRTYIWPYYLSYLLRERAVCDVDAVVGGAYFVVVGGAYFVAEAKILNIVYSYQSI